MPGLIQRFKQWRGRRRATKLARNPATLDAALAKLTPGERAQLASFSSPTWDDVEQRYTMLGPMTPVYTTGFQGDEIDKLLRASAWSWASINGNAKAMAQLTPIVQERKAGKWETAPPAHPLNDFLADPLGSDETFPYWSWSHLYYVLALHYYAVGNSYLLPVQTMAGGLQVIPLLHPESMDAEVDSEYEIPTLYKYSRPGQPDRTWKPSEIVNVQAPNPSSFWRGAAPLRAALRSTEIDQVASERQRYNLRNKVAAGSPIFSFDLPLGPTPEQIIAEKTRLEADFTDVQDTGKPLFLGSGAKAIPGFNSEELQVFETKGSAREEIIATIGTQPAVMGQLDGATYSNTKEATVLWFSASIGPILQIIYGHLNAQLVHRQYDTSTRLWYSHAGSHIGMQLLKAKLEVGLDLQKLGYTTNDIDAHLEMGMGEKDYLNKSTDAATIAGHVEPVIDGDEPDTEEDDDSTEAPQPFPVAVAD